MNKFVIEIFSPDGEFTEEEIREMINDWLEKKRKEGILFRLLPINVEKK